MPESQNTCQYVPIVLSPKNKYACFSADRTNRKLRATQQWISESCLMGLFDLENFQARLWGDPTLRDRHACFCATFQCHLANTCDTDQLAHPCYSMFIRFLRLSNMRYFANCANRCDRMRQHHDQCWARLAAGDGMDYHRVPESLHCWHHHHIPEIPSESH